MSDIDKVLDSLGQKYSTGALAVVLETYRLKMQNPQYHYAAVQELSILILHLENRDKELFHLRHFQNEVLGEIGWSDEDEESGTAKSSYCVGEIRHLRELIKKHDRGVKVLSCPKCGSFGDGEKFVYCDNCGYGLR